MVHEIIVMTVVATMGLNAVIQAIVMRAAEYAYEVLGVLGGYLGLLNGDVKPFSLEDVEDIYKVETTS